MILLQDLNNPKAAVRKKALTKISQAEIFVPKVLRRRHRKNWLIYCLALLLLPLSILTFIYTTKERRPRYVYDRQDHIVFHNVDLETMEQDIIFTNIRKGIFDREIQLFFQDQNYIIPNFAVERTNWIDLNNDGIKELALQIAQSNALYSRIFAYNQGDLIAVTGVGKYGYNYEFSGALWMTTDKPEPLVVNIYRTYADDPCQPSANLLFDYFDGQQLINIKEDYIIGEMECPGKEHDFDLTFVFDEDVRT